MKERSYLISLALCLSTLALDGDAASASLLSSANLSRRSLASQAVNTSHDFVLTQNSPISGGVQAHSSHSSHASHSSHVSSSTGAGSGPYVPPPTATPVATPSATLEDTDSTAAPIPTPFPSPTPRASAPRSPAKNATAPGSSATGWHPYKVVHVVEVSVLVYDVELTDRHIYHIQRHVPINWVPGDDVKLRSQVSSATREIYYAIMGPEGNKFEASRSR